MSAYESGSRKIIPAVLVYAFHLDHVLMLSRETNLKDIHFGKWNGLGGKLEAGESVLDAAQREFYEEAGIQFSKTEFKFLGFLQFPEFKAKKNEDWWVSVFRIDVDHFRFAEGRKIDEGILKWIPVSEVLTLNLWPGDHIFLPYVFDCKGFYGSFNYQSGALVSYQINSINNVDC